MMAKLMKLSRHGDTLAGPTQVGTGRCPAPTLDPVSHDPFGRESPATPGATVPSQTLALLSAVLADAPFGFALVDTELRYVHVNEMLAALNAMTPEEHRGLRPVDISPELDALVGSLLREVLTSREPIIGHEVSVVPPGDATRTEWLFNVYPVGAGDELIGLAVAVFDVTERRRDVHRLETQALHLAAVVDIGMAALSGTSVRKLVPAAVATTRDVLDADLVAILRTEPGGEQFVLEALDPEDPELLGTVVVRPGDHSIAGQALAAGGAIVSNDVDLDDRFETRPSAGRMPVRSAAAVLIPGGEQPFGVLCMYSQEQRNISDDEVRFIQAIANVLGTAVERRRTERALEASNARLRMAQEAGRMGVWEWDLRGDVIIWSDALEHLWGLPTGGFDGSYETFDAMVHPDDRARVNDAVSGARRGDAYELEHRIRRADNGEVRWIVARGDTIRDESGTPIRMIGINVDITERKVVEEERYSLLRAEQAARAAAERSRERLTFLSEATGALSASLDYHETLQAVTRLAVPEYADICIVDLLEVGQLQTVAVAHATPSAEEQVWDLRRRFPAATAADDPTRETLRYAQPLLFTDMPTEVLAAMAVNDEHLALLHALRVRSGIIVPLIARGRVLGTLSLIRTDEHEPFEGVDDQTLVMELGRRAALAIDNARLYAEAEQTGDRFRRMAETLQASLLPPNLPSVPGIDLAAIYRAAAAGTTVGGDFYDVFPLTDRGWGVVIGDVQGKGTEAATVTGIARHTIRTAAMRRNPAGSLHVLNEALLQGEEHDNRFCTVLFGQLEPSDEGAHIDFASGGHPPALLRRADGTVEAVGGQGTLMGVIKNISLHTEAVELRPGDAVVLYTDGVTEARGPQGEFGEQRLAETLAAAQAATAAELAAAVEHAVTEFSGGRFRDDIAILVVRAAAS